MAYRSYDAAFKQKVVDFAKKTNQSTAAHEFGVSWPTVHKWLKELGG